MTGRLEKLAQEGLRGDRNRLAVGKRVGSGVREVAHDLKGVRGAGRLLHRRERMGYDGVSRLRLDKKPGRAVLRDQKIHFGLRLVPYVVERVVAEAEDFHCERYIKIGHRHQYQTDRWVRMANTKLTDGSEWYWFRNQVWARVPRARRLLNRRNVPPFQERGRGLRPSFSPASKTGAKVYAN